MNPPDSEATIAWRVGALEAGLTDERLARRADVNKLDSEKAEARDVQVLSEEVRALRRGLLIFSLSMIGTGVTFLLGVLALVNAP